MGLAENEGNIIRNRNDGKKIKSLAKSANSFSFYIYKGQQYARSPKYATLRGVTHQLPCL